MTGETTTPAPSLVRLAAGFYGIVVVFAVGYAFFDWLRRGSPLPEDYLFLGLGLPTWGHALAGVGLGLLIVGVVHVGLRAVPAVQKASVTLAEVLGPLTKRDALWLALLSGVAEELLFRGALWPHLGLLGTTFLFGLVHIVPRRSLWAYPVFAAGAGLLLGILRDASGSVLPPIIAHVTVNGLNLWWLGKHAARLTGTPAAVDA